MIRQFKFKGASVADDIREVHGFDGELLRLFSENSGPIVHKWHHYIPLYDRYFSRFRSKPLRFLEIGVSDGGSLELWRKYFGGDATIFGVDINPDCARFNDQAAQVRIGSQNDPKFLQDVVEEMGGIDIVLDDGSHEMAHIETTLQTLFPLLDDNGIYVIEDLHTAYWEKWGGGYGAEGNFFNTVRRFIDDMHGWYHPHADEADSIGRCIKGIHVHDSMVAFEKGVPTPPVHSRIGEKA